MFFIDFLNQQGKEQHVWCNVILWIYISHCSSTSPHFKIITWLLQEHVVEEINYGWNYPKTLSENDQLNLILELQLL